MLAVILYRQLFLQKGKIMTENNNNQNLYANDKIHVNSYNRDDGTHVKDYYRSRPNQTELHLKEAF